MAKLNLIKARKNLYNSPINKIDKNLKSLLRAEKEYALSKRIDDELEI